MTIIILGGTGFFGKSLLKKLKEKKLSYKLLIHEKTLDDKFCFLGDISNATFLENYVCDNDVIVNLVGQKNENMFEQNVKGSYNLLNSIIKKKNVRVIFASTLLVYGETIGNTSNENDLPKPVNNYGMIKLLSENIYKLYSDLFRLDITVLRFANIYDHEKKHGIISNCIKSITQQKPIMVTQTGNQVRDFLYIDDAVQAILNVIQNQPKGFEIFNICSGIGIEINQVIEIFEKYSKKKISKIYVDDKSDVKSIIGDNFKAKSFLNFFPKTDIDTGIKYVIENINKLI